MSDPGSDANPSIMENVKPAKSPPSPDLEGQVARDRALSDESVQVAGACGRIQCRSGCTCRGSNVDKWATLIVTILIAILGIVVTNKGR